MANYPNGTYCFGQARVRPWRVDSRMGRLHTQVGKATRPGPYQSGRQDSAKGKGRDLSPGLRQENLASVKRAYRLFFFFDAFLAFFLPAFFFGFDFFAVFFRAVFFFPAFLARFFAAGLAAGFGAGAASSGSSPTITSSSSSSTISSVSPPSSSSSSRDSSLSSSKWSFSISIPSSRGGIFGSGQKTGPWVAVLARALSNAAPPLRRCYRTRWKLSSILRFSCPAPAKAATPAMGIDSPQSRVATLGP